MKLRKHPAAKAVILGVVVALFGLFFGLIRAEPRINAAEPATPSPPVEYDRFFAPNGSRSEPQSAVPTPAPRPYTRTRGS